MINKTIKNTPVFLRKEKKRVEKELLSTFQDETIIVLADWLKVPQLVFSNFS